MLDLDHPQTQHIFAASGLLDFLMQSAQRMTVLPSPQRAALLAQCRPVLEQLRRLNQEHFHASSFNFEAIDQAQVALEQLAHLTHLNGGTIVDDHSDGEGECSACGTLITKFETYRGSGRFVIVCGHCDEPFMRAKAKLESVQGFGTCFI